MKVVDFINRELQLYQEEPFDFLIRIYEGKSNIINAWIEYFKDQASKYLDREIVEIEAYSEEAYVYIKEVINEMGKT